ncbi:MAG: hypothetical protein IT381_00415 [Deltaproteobacteria bacterium]|nr:hypothetical protein [Deltaproteobacteria bacterium]
MSTLAEEGRYLARFLFAAPLAEAVIDHYVAAHVHLFTGAITRPVDVAKIVERRLDAEAVELVLRRRDPMNALSQKMQILVYVAEARRELYPLFVSEHARPFTAFVRLAWGVVRAAYKLVKGRYLLSAHRDL